MREKITKLINCLRNIRGKTDYFLEDLKKMDQIHEENFLFAL